MPKKSFSKVFKGKTDAEKKRKTFRNKFYKTLSKIAAEEKIEVIAQGNIKADVIETTKGIKS